MNYFDYFLQKSRKALAEYSASAFLAGTKALAKRMGLPGRHSANIRQMFVVCLPGRCESKRQIDE